VPNRIKFLMQDVIIIGAGIVGLATAYKLKEAKPNLKITILEKENDIALHQTGHNSGVIHSGIYYKPGSLKAINCKKGYDQLLTFCKDYGVEFDLCGKIIVAVEQKELQSLENIYNRGVANELSGIRKITQAEIKEIEPYCSGIAGVWVPQTGIINYTEVSKKYKELFLENGGVLELGQKVIDIKQRDGINYIETSKSTFQSKWIINCAGLYSDKVAKLSSDNIDLQIIPFRGEYYDIKKEKEYLVKNLIYPVPNPDFPFLGVHFTRMIKGGVEAGPNAVFAFRREGYTNTDINLKELFESLTFRGFQKVAVKYWRDGMYEMYRSYSKAAFVRALQRLIPDIQSEDIVKGSAGVRAQACDSKGNLIDDFLIYEKHGVIDVCNAPSPAATSSLSIGETIAEKLLKTYN
jgi:(S)-2-hydroxyglutarate dehydrogenase